MSRRDEVWKKCVALVDWYERFKPEAGLRLDVDLSPADLWKSR